MEATCINCDSINIILQNATYGLYYCQDCGNHFSEEDFVEEPRAARRRPRRGDDEDYDDYE